LAAEEVGKRGRITAIEQVDAAIAKMDAGVAAGQAAFDRPAWIADAARSTRARQFAVGARRGRKVSFVSSFRRHRGLSLALFSLQPISPLLPASLGRHIGACGSRRPHACEKETSRL
jgi:hypothetical protein